MATVRTGRVVRVRAPATSANLGPGFDCLGLALQRYDEVSVEATTGSLRIEVDGEGANSVPRDGAHLVVSTMRRALTEWGAELSGLVLRCANDIPHGRGLGSSAAAIVTGLAAARALLDDGDAISDGDLLDLASRVEGHPDNVAACLHGGLTVAWASASGTRCVRLEPHAQVAPVVLVPGEAMATERARGLLPSHVSHADAAFTGAHAALLVLALTQDPELLHAATEDRLHQPYRAAAMPATADLLQRLRADGIPAVVSGAGPSVLAFFSPSGREDLRGLADDGWDVRRVDVDRTGVRIVDVDDRAP